jgi:hypothetical protein
MIPIATDAHYCRQLTIRRINLQQLSQRANRKFNDYFKKTMFSNVYVLNS